MSAEIYKPEVAEDYSFEMLKGKGHICKVNSAVIEDKEGGMGRDGTPYEGYSRLSIELEVVSEKYKGRRVWKNVNLDNKVRTGKKNKTPIEKLADMFYTVGLEFQLDSEGVYDVGSLNEALEKFVELVLVVSFNSFKPKDATEAMQLFTVTGVSDAPVAAAEAGERPSF